MYSLLSTLIWYNLNIHIIWNNKSMAKMLAGFIEMIIIL